MCGRKELFIEMKEISPKDVIGIGGKRLQAVGIGKVLLNVIGRRGERIKMTLQEVLYLPNLEDNLLSVSKLTHHGLQVKFEETSAIIGGKNFEIELKKRQNLYALVGTEIQTQQVESLRDWHIRLGHLDLDMICRMLKLQGIKVRNDMEGPCEICLRTKLNEKSFIGKMQRTSKPLERVHSDLLGPIQVEAFPGNKKYIISFIDDYSKFTQVYLMKNKSESLDKLKKFIAEIGIPRELHTDNGGEYTSNAFKEFCIEKSIKQTFTIPYTPQQNSIAERFWKTLMAMIRAMLKQADMEKKWWGKACLTAVYTWNRTLRGNQDKSPYEIFFNNSFDLNKLKTFGAWVIALNKDPRRGKLDDRGLTGRFIGYVAHNTSYIIHLSESNKIISSRTVKFLTKPPSFIQKSKIEDESDEELSIPDQIIQRSTIDPATLNIPEINPIHPQVESSTLNPQESENDELNQVITPPMKEKPFEPRRSERVRTMSRIGLESLQSSKQAKVEETEPQSFKEAITCTDADEWWKSMQNEINSQIQQETIQSFRLRGAC
jgi:hypothetical protein